MSEEKLEFPVTLEDGTIVEDGTNNVPQIFTREQYEYLAALTGHSILRDLKGELLNIIEGCGMPEKQETAVKRMVTNALHDWHHGFKDDIELVLIGDNKNDLYCGNCVHLSLTEADQSITQQGIPHICLKYGRQVKHGLHHPELPRLDICIAENGKKSR